MDRVLVITPFFHLFSRVGTFKRVTNFVDYLPEDGWEPIILTMDWGYKNLSIRNDKKIYYTRNIAYASWKAYHAADIETENSWKAFLLKKLVGFLRLVKTYCLIPDELIVWILWVIPKSREIIKKENPKIIFVAAPPFSSLLLGVILKKMYHIPLVCDVRDDWIGSPLTQKKNKVLDFIEKKMEKWVVRNSEKIVLVTSDSYMMWRKRYPEAVRKINLIPNGYNEEEFNAVPEYEFSDFALVHAGSIEMNRSPELIFRSLSKLDAKAKGIRFYQYGLTLRYYRDMASRYGVEDYVQFEDIIKSDEAIARIKGASILILLPTQNAPTAIPGKAYEYLYTGKPILLISRENATTTFMKSFPNVYIILPDDEERCIETINKIYDNRETLKTNVVNDVIKQYDRKKLTAQLAEIFNLLHKQ